ncbi:MAG: FMN-binding protein [Alkalispirochaetaceae bacterium]
MNKQSIGYTIFFTFLVTFVFVLLLSLTNQATVDMIERNQQLDRQRAILTAMGLDVADPNEISERYDEVETVEDNGMTLYETTIDGRQVYAKEFSGSGLWGTINGVLGVTGDLSRTTGLAIISHNETPGLGGRITEDWFQRQLEGEQIPEETLRVTSGEGDYDYDNGEIDGITGATRTSESMEVILNRELDTLRETIGG